MSETAGLTILGKEIAPGTSEVFNLHVGQLPSATKLFLKAHVFCASEPGPTMLVLAGMHGDEVNGIEIVRRSLEIGLFEEIKAGNIIVIPVLNIYGFINFSRHVPDGKDVNRSFPGSSRGSLASRVARILSKNVLPLVDFGLDFHTGGNNRFNYPQIRYSRKDERAHQLARQFAAPVTIEKGLIPKSLRKIAKDAKVPIIVFEGGESLRLDGFVIENALRGIKRIMVANGYIDGELPELPMRHFLRSTWVRANSSGIFIWSQRSGNAVVKGEPIGKIYAPQGTTAVTVTASRDGFIIGHNNTPVVHKGDALFHLAYEEVGK